jgi:hypothetical protein
MVHGPVLLLSAFSMLFLHLISCEESVSICNSISEIDHKFVAIGDIHGSWETFQKILIGANITNGVSCEWLPQSRGVTLIQMGDVVDRGAGATESWQCLDKLQDTAPENCKVIRLIGNHELMWLQGVFRDAHKADTKEKRLAIVNSLKHGIQESKIVGSYFTTINQIPVMFIHAGFRPQMIEYITDKFQVSSTPRELSSFVNGHVKSAIQHCMKSGVSCNLNTEIFGAGSERGGRNIGGPFWTDYRVLAKAAAEPNFLPNMIQVRSTTPQFSPSCLSMN